MESKVKEILLKTLKQMYEKMNESADKKRIGKMITKLEKKFSIEEIKEIWFRIYGEELEEDYPGFIEELEKEE